MARASRIWPNLYFGRPGALVTIPYPRGDIGRDYERLISDFVTGSGQHLISLNPLGSRLYGLNWTSLHGDTYALLEQYWVGSMGVGPWALVDPAVNNMLQPNQASATNNLMDTTGWKTSTALANEGTILINTDPNFIHRTGATRSIRWQFPVTPATTPILMTTPPYRNWSGIPVMVGLPYAFSAWVKPDGVIDSNITASARIRWYDATGSMLSEITSGDTAVTTWTKLSVTGTAPANAAYAWPLFTTTGSTITNGGSLYVDEILLEQDNAFNTWAPGTGIRAVEILGLTATVPFDAKWVKSIALNLRELVQ